MQKLSREGNVAQFFIILFFFFFHKKLKFYSVKLAWGEGLTFKVDL